MAIYFHPELENFVSPSAFTLDGVQYSRAWWRTVTTQEIEALGFQEQEPSPPDVDTAILSAPLKGFGGPTAKELFHGNR